jgi:alpha-tubulin suppressor-like RCC1 family protein
LSLGTRHSLALSSDGGVYAWGNPAAVGPFSSSTSARVPVRIPDSAFNNHKIVSVSAANDFSIAVCDQGDLYAWGIGLTSLPFWTQISNTPVIVE